VTASYIRDDYSLAAINANEWQLGAAYALTFGNRLGIDFQLNYGDRHAASALGDYRELAGRVFLRYRGVQRRSLVEFPK
jgi:hypothetical protein